jgi:hypothetical protein
VQREAARVLYYWHFGERRTINWLAPSSKLTTHEHERQGRRLERLHDIVWEALWAPDVTGAEPRTKSIFDFDGIGNDGQPQTFAQFLRRLTSNKHRRHRKQKFKHEKKQRRFEVQINYADADTEALPRDGSVSVHGNPHSYAEPPMSTANILPAPASADVDTVTVVPVELKIKLDLVLDRFRAEYPHIAAHRLGGVWSASAIEKRLKDAGNTMKPAGRKTIGPVLDNFDAELHDAVQRFCGRKPNRQGS